MDQSLFDGIAAALASMDYSKSEEYKNHKMKDFLNMLKPSYEKHIIDDGVWEEVLITAKNIQKIIKKTVFKGDFLKEYSQYCYKVTAEGKKTPLFNGLYFNKIFKKSIQIPNKKENSLKRAKNYFKLNFGINIIKDSKISSSKKSKPKKTNLKKDVEWFDGKPLKKVDKSKIIEWNDGYKPKEQWKSIRKFPLTGYWVFIEKNHKNKFNAYLRKLSGQYWENFTATGSCKDFYSAWNSLKNKIMKQ